MEVSIDNSSIIGIFGFPLSLADSRNTGLSNPKCGS